MSRINKRKCLHCKLFFTPSPQNINHQRHCSKADCRKESKRARQKRWLSKPDNKDYFKGEHHVERVRIWRKAHPGYWKHKRVISEDALQDSSSSKTVDTKGMKPLINTIPLQDTQTPESLVLIGLIAKITETALQDDIAQQVDGLLQLGRDITSPKRTELFNSS